MKRIFHSILALLLLLSANSQAQVIFDFASATATAAPIGYQKTGVGTYFKGTTGGTISDGSANCDSYTPSKVTSSSIFYFVAESDVTKITVRGTGTGSNRTFTAFATSSTLAGTYTTDATAAGTGTINGSTCGSIEITPTSTVTAGTYMKFTFSGNLNVTSIVFTTISGTAPTVTTTDPVATSITENSATLNGAITDAGTGTVTVSGFCYGLTANPTTAGTKTTDGGTSVGAITSNITGLSFSTTYHVRAYATSSFGTSYGSDVTFTTAAPSSPIAIVNPLSLNFGSQLLNTTSVVKTISISGAALTPADGDLTVTAPAGYQVSTSSSTGFASSITVPYTGGVLAATTLYVNFTPTALVSYPGNITITGGGLTTINVTVSGSGTDVVYETGDYKSVASANWGTASTWNKWDGSAWVASTDFPNASTANVYIVDGFTVNAETSGRRVKNLYVDGNSILKSSNKVNSPIYVKVFGATVSVTSGSLIGNLLAGNDADGISIDDSSANLTLTGGGTINLSRIRTNVASSVLTINNDVTINYHGSGNGGNAAGIYTVTGDNNTITVNAGKTLTFAPWSCYTPVASSHTNTTNAQTFNINGTLTFVDGTVPGNATANGWSGHTNGYMSLGVTGKSMIVNIGATGTLNVSELYPNGTKADNTPGTGDVSTINVAAGGVLNVTKIADFRNAAQTVTGDGQFKLATGAKIRIASPDGVTTAAAAGPIRTAVRTFADGSAYAYEGAAAQVTGNAVPANISGLIINNAAGVTLTNSAAVSDSLNLTNGVLTTTATELLTVNATAVTNGGSTASHVSGPVKKLTASTTAYAFPIGKGGVYRPATVTPVSTDASSYTAEYFNSAAANTTSVTNPITSVSTSEYWNIEKGSGANAAVTLAFDNTKTTAWSNSGAPDVSQDICVAHFVGGSWIEEAGTTGTTILGDQTSGNVTSQELGSFSPFTFGLKPHGVTPVRFISFNATSVNGQTKLVWATANEVNIANYVIERSVDGRNYSNAGSVKAGNSNYNFTDAGNNSGVTYYRIKIIDQSGKSGYSTVIAVNNKKLNSLSIFPNPVVSTLYVSHAKAVGGAKVEIYSMDGRKVNEYKVAKDAIQTTVNAGGLSAGNYTLVFVNGEEVQHTRFVKQ